MDASSRAGAAGSRLGNPSPPEPPEAIVSRSAKAPRVHRAREKDAARANGPLDHNWPRPPIYAKAGKPAPMRQAGAPGRRRFRMRAAVRQ